MTEDQYIEVCKITDEILQSKSSSSTRVALPFLHVVRGHHLFLQKYENPSTVLWMTVYAGWNLIFLLFG